MHHLTYCMRSDCQQTATAQLTYDYARQAVWLVPLTNDVEPGEWPMCTRHANALNVPRGWEIHDDREPEVPESRQTAVQMFAAYAS